MKQLTREDIVGRKIKQIWRTPWQIEGKYHSCDSFIELENGSAFLLDQRDLENENLIPAVNLNELELIPENYDDEYVKTVEKSRFFGLLKYPAQEKFRFDEIKYKGQKICEVLICKGAPSLVLALENKLFINTDVYESFYTSAIAWRLGEYLWTLEDFSTYWGHNPIDETIFEIEKTY